MVKIPLKNLKNKQVLIVASPKLAVVSKEPFVANFKQTVASPKTAVLNEVPFVPSLKHCHSKFCHINM